MLSRKLSLELGSRALSMNRDPLSKLSSIPFSNAFHYLGIFNLGKQSPGDTQRLGSVLGNRLAELQSVPKMGPLPASGVSALLPLPFPTPACFPSSLIMTAVLCHRGPRWPCPNQGKDWRRISDEHWSKFRIGLPP